jgi:hypothetical protein
MVDKVRMTIWVKLREIWGKPLDFAKLSLVQLSGPTPL